MWLRCSFPISAAPSLVAAFLEKRAAVTNVLGHEVSVRSIHWLACKGWNRSWLRWLFFPPIACYWTVMAALLFVTACSVEFDIIVASTGSSQHTSDLMFCKKLSYSLTKGNVQHQLQLHQYQGMLYLPVLDGKMWWGGWIHHDEIPYYVSTWYGGWQHACQFYVFFHIELMWVLRSSWISLHHQSFCCFYAVVFWICHISYKLPSLITIIMFIEPSYILYCGSLALEIAFWFPHYINTVRPKWVTH